MNLRSLLLAAAFVSLLPTVARCDDKVVAIDAANGLITIEQRGTMKAFKVRKFTEVTLNGSKASIDQLRPGMMVTFSLSDPQTVSKVTARGNPAQPGTASSPGASIPAGTTRRITIKLSVDGSDIVKIGQGRLWIEHVSAKRPKDISVNGVKWEPSWNGNTSEFFTGFTSGLVPFDAGKVSVKQTSGRGETTIEEPPTAANEQTLSFQIRDGGSGSDVHEVRVTW